LPQRFKTPNENIVYEQFDKDLVILNLESGQYFGVNEAGAAVWLNLMDGGAPDDIAPTGMAALVAGFIEQLLGFGLIEADAAPPTAHALEITTAPTIEVFDDLSDLIIADPIHDVDIEAGWPTMPEQD